MMWSMVNWMAGMAVGADNNSPMLPVLRERLDRHLEMVENRLSQVDYFAGPEFTAADIMMHFPFGTMRAFYDLGFDNRPNIKAWLARISDRPGYQRGMKAAGHEQDPVLEGNTSRAIGLDSSA